MNITILRSHTNTHLLDSVDNTHRQTRDTQTNTQSSRAVPSSKSRWTYKRKHMALLSYVANSTMFPARRRTQDRLDVAQMLMCFFKTLFILGIKSSPPPSH